MTESDIRKVLEEINALSKVVFAKEKHWKVEALEQYPPAAAKEIEALSRKMPFPLPPSYKEFLAATNGCANFWPNFILLGASGDAHDQVNGAIEDAREYQMEDATSVGGSITVEEVVTEVEQIEKGRAITAKTASSKGSLTPEDIRAYEKQKVPRGTPPYFFVAAHSVFGANNEGEFLFFNELKTSKAGEPEVIHYSYDGRVEERFKNFEDFMQKTALDLKKRIQDKKYKS